MPEVIGRIDHIAYYPIKGGARLDVPRAIVTKHGISGDRDYAVVRAESNAGGFHEVITQRDKQDESARSQGFSALTQIHSRPSGAGLYITWGPEYRDAITVQGDIARTEIPVQVWGDRVTALDQGDEVANWLSDYLGANLRLVRATESPQRSSRQTYLANDNTLRFQDGYPGHWFFQESVDKLSDAAEEVIEWTIFRPNIVVSGSAPQTEHQIYSGRFGGVEFKNPKPCDRCPVTNVDQQSGEIKVGRALKHLAKYKRWTKATLEKVVIFGENLIFNNEGEISVGDEVALTERRNPTLVYGGKS